MFAKWDLVFTFKFGRAGSSGFFFNEFTGFIAGAANSGIYKTTDGGKTWTACNIPAGFQYNVTQIFMTDSLRGWASVEEQSPTLSGIWRTSDGGLNWTTAGPIGDYSCIYETPSAVVISSRENYGRGNISTNAGATFTIAPALDTINGIDFTDNSHGVATGFYGRPWQQTNDGGRTWTKIQPAVQIESWGVYGMKGTSNFFACPEKDLQNPINRTASTLYRSNDYGSTWAAITKLPVTSTGAIEGAAGVLYVQADTNSSINTIAANRTIYRSTDQGATWVNVGGPPNQKDSRFVVTGCHGGVVYAFDDQGNVWKTRDGGDGGIQEPPLELQIDKNSILLAGTICTTTYATVRLLNLYCEDDKLVSVSLTDPNSNLFTSGALTLTSQPNLPLILTIGKEDSIVFRWEPFKLFHLDTMLTTQLHLQYYSNILQRVVDTVITLLIHAIGEAPSASLSPTVLNFGPVSFCKSYDTTVTIKNLGCDTLFIIDTAEALSGGYALTDSKGNPLSFPIIIIPNDSFTFKVDLSLDAAGNYSNRVTLELMHQGIRRDTSFTLNASMSSAGSFAVTDSVFVGSVSTCGQLDTVVILKNFGCKPLTILGASLQKGTEFSLTGTPPYTSPVPPGGVSNIPLKFIPSGSGNFTDILSLKITSLGENMTVNIPLRGVGYTSQAFLASLLPLDTLFDLLMSRCDSPKIINPKLSNPGCKTLTIISVTATPANSGPDISITNDNTPTDLVNNQSYNLSIVVTPHDTAIYDGRITISYEIDNVLHDTTLLYFLNVGYGSRILQTSVDTINLDTMRFCSTKDTSLLLRNLGCDSLLIQSIRINGQGNFTITNSPKLSFRGNDSTTISFHFEPTISGAINGQLVIQEESDPSVIKTIPIKAFIIPTDTLVFDIGATRPLIYAGDTVSFLIIPRENVHNKGLNSIAFSVNYNSDLLTLDPVKSKVLTPNVSYIPGQDAGTPKHTTTQIFLQGQPTIELDAGSPMMSLVFVARITDSITTSMFLSDILLNGGDATYAKCTLGIISSDIGYTIGLRCGEATLVKYMQLGSAETLLTSSIIPNPLTRENGFRAELPFLTNLAGDIRFDVFDPLGRPVLNSILAVSEKGEYHFTIDAGGLSSGLYSYLLRHLANGASVSGRFSVIR
ncbi:MAG TPA: choice-of-anchor D domain-containing protein [Candidatus Kapabacteria bacterium]|nr:choice-of-anchor D domain-containing protein [Candidatus Kapabacteria bacterium]